MDETSLFWMLWLVSTGLCFGHVARAWRHSELMLEWPFIVSIMCLYFYGYMAMSAHLNLSHAFAKEDALLGQLTAIICLLGVFLGWRVGKKSHTVEIADKAYDCQKLLKIGLLLTLFGALAHLSFHGTSLDQTGKANFQGSSAYWYMCFLVGYPGLAMSVWAISQIGILKSKTLLFLTVVIFGVFLFPHLNAARRGPLFPAIVILLFVPSFSLRKKPNPVWMTTGLLVAGFLMLAFVQVRAFTYNDGTWSEAFSKITIDEVVSTKANQIADNEYVNHVHMIASLSETGNYQFGTGHLGLFLHWIPREVWPSKPGIGEGWFSQSEMMLDVNRRAGVDLIGGGAAAGGFADSFVQYGYLSPLFWFCLSYYFARQYSSASRSFDPNKVFSYMAILCSTHWLISQGFAAAFVPYLIFLVVPKLLFRFINFEETHPERTKLASPQYSNRLHLSDHR